MNEDSEPGLATTKVRAPVPPGRLVRRSRLDDVLDAAVDRQVPLLLVSAPAGSGKSTLLASWVAQRNEDAAWLQVEELDSDPARFWSYLVAAIGQVRPEVADDLQPRIAGSGGDDDVVVPALVNRLAALVEPLIVVVDDYHLVEDSRIHRGVERLIDLCPPQATVVLATRMDPPFRLGRLRVRSRIVEIRADDLRFAPDEAAGVLGGIAATLDPAVLDELCRRTEGWAAGLVLAGLSLQRSPDPEHIAATFSGDDRLVVEYLRDELLGSLDAADHERMLETSVLDQLSGGLVDAVTGGTGGGPWLRRTAQTNQLLVALDGTGTWFRFHHLVRDLLRLEARDAMPHRLPELHRRAAAWFESVGDHGRAVDHRLAAGDTAAAARLMQVHGTMLMRAGQIDTLRGALERLGGTVRTDFGCALLQGWCDYLGGRYAQAERWADIALDVAPDGFDETLATPLRINVALATGDVAGALDEARAVLDAGPLDARRPDLATAVGAAHAWAGVSEVARSVLELAVEWAEADGSRSAQTLALVYRAIVELEHGTSDSARRAAAAAIDAAERFGLTRYHGVAPAFAVRARCGDDAGRSRADADLALVSARQSSTPLALGYVLAVCGDALLELGDPTGSALLGEARSVLGRCPDPGIAERALRRAESRHGVATPAAPVDGMIEQLTDRELAVLRYLPSGLSQRDIATELFVSLNTVKTHCRAIYRKLGVAGRHEAVQAARDHRIL